MIQTLTRQSSKYLLSLLSCCRRNVSLTLNCQCILIAKQAETILMSRSNMADMCENLAPNLVCYNLINKRRYELFKTAAILMFLILFFWIPLGFCTNALYSFISNFMFISYLGGGGGSYRFYVQTKISFSVSLTPRNVKINLKNRGRIYYTWKRYLPE